MAEAADRRAAGDGAHEARLPALEWQKLRERNEALDCRVYARAAAWIAGADRWSEARWQELERQLAVDVEGHASRCSPVKSSARPSAQRRTVRSSYMG